MFTACKGKSLCYWLLLELKANISKSIISEADSGNQKAKMLYRNKAKKSLVYSSSLELQKMNEQR